MKRFIIVKTPKKTLLPVTNYGLHQSLGEIIREALSGGVTDLSTGVSCYDEHIDMYDASSNIREDRFAQSEQLYNDALCKSHQKQLDALDAVKVPTLDADATDNTEKSV